MLKHNALSEIRLKYLYNFNSFLFDIDSKIKLVLLNGGGEYITRPRGSRPVVSCNITLLIELPLPNLNVVAVIVSFHPDMNAMQRLISNLQNQVGSIRLVDNTPGTISQQLQQLLSSNPKLMLTRSGANMGLAAAQNMALEAALAEADQGFAITFDQDSIPSDDMVEKLVATHLKLSSRGMLVGAIGPNYVDPRYQNLVPFLQLNGFKVKRCKCESDDEVCDVDYLIASGSLMSFETLRKVGLMKSEFFIDYIDIEWGLRAQSMGYQSYGACSARMIHSLGDQPVQKFGRSIPVHSPLRHYYHFRNGIWLHCRSNYSWKWKVVDAYRLLRQYFFYSLFIGNRLEHFVAITQGIFDGIRGKLGPK